MMKKQKITQSGREDFVSEDIMEMMISHLGEFSGINEVAAFFISVVRPYALLILNKGTLYSRNLEKELLLWSEVWGIL